MPLAYSFQARDGSIAFRCPMQCQQCEGHTKTGARCGKRVCIGTPLCWQHLLAQKNLRIKPSVHGGKGLFAQLPGRRGNDRQLLFRPNAIICDYGGERITKQALNTRYGNYTAPYALFIRHTRGGYYKNAACKRGPGAMANHADAASANAKLAHTGGGTIVATKPIYDGDEILVDYGQEYGFNEPVVDKTHSVARRLIASRPRLRRRVG